MSVKRVGFLAIVFVGAMVLCLPGGLLAQSATSGSVTGTVIDPSGGAVPGAKVTLTQTSTNTTLTALTNAAGHYVFPVVPPSTYDLRVSKAGFSVGIVTGVSVEVLKSVSVNIRLKIGQASQVVTVSATAGSQLQTTNATVGNVLQTAALTNLPQINRNATSLMFLQPAMTPNSTGPNTGGQIAGARSDQIYYTVDGGDGTSDLEGTNNYPNTASSGLFGAASSTALIATPISMTEEFRVTTAGQSAAFSRTAGGQVAVQTKTGTNQFHGSLYEYHADDALFANSWLNNAVGLAKPHQVDNRFGATVGGPLVWPHHGSWLARNRAWFFFGFEGHRFNDSTSLTRLVPTDTLRQGIIRFRDAAGNINSYSLTPGNVSSNCGSSGIAACDPRGIGMSPTIKSQLALYPVGHTSSLGDGLNTIGYTFNLPTPLKEYIGVVRLDFKVSPKWSFFTTYHLNRIDRVSTSQVNIVSNPPSTASSNPVEPSMISFEATGSLSPNLTMVFHGSYSRNFWAWERTPPAPFVSGTTQALQLAGEGLGSNNGTGKLLADPININTGSARARIWDGHDWYIADDMNWVHGNHLFQFGAGGYIFHDFHLRTDDVIGGLSSGPILFIESTGNGNGEFLNTSGALPPICSGSVTQSCLPGNDSTRFKELYAAVLGMVDRGTQIIARNGNFQPSPLGTAPYENATLPAFTTYFQDTWRMTANLTGVFGLAWGVQLPVSERQGKIVVPVYAASDQPLGFQSYLSARKASLEQQGVSVVNGQLNAYNPLIGLSPAGYLPRGSGLRGEQGVTAWHDFSPRIALAWRVPYSNWLFGHNADTVIRGSYAILYDRITAVTPVLGNLLAGGLADVNTCGGPLTNGSCSGLATTPSTAFRIGVDGNNAPIPAPTAEPIPFVPSGTQAAPFGEFLMGPNDPYRTPGWNHNVTLSIQRALPHEMLLEIGYIGRFSRNLTQYWALNAPDYLTKDAKSGQTYAQAFDGVAQALRNGTSVPNEPFFNNLIGLSKCTQQGYQNCSQLVAAADPGDLINGDLNSFGQFTFNFLTPSPLDNLQSTYLDGPGAVGFSNYNGGYISLRKTFGGGGALNGLSLQMNYTLSHSIGNQGQTQESLNSPNSPYHPSLDYSDELFDRRSVLTTWWNYQLPFGRGQRFHFNQEWMNRVVGGWYTSGIWSLYSGLPQCISADGNYGSFFSNGTCAIAINGFNLHGAAGQTHANVTGSNGIGTSTLGVNLFKDPAAVFSNVRRPLLSKDGQIPFGSMRNPVEWNVDIGLGKNIAVTERYKVVFSADFLNAFNHPNFASPSTNLNSPATFGTFSNTANDARKMQLGLLIQF